MHSLLHTTYDVELRLFRHDLRTIERTLSRGPSSGSDKGCCGVTLAQCHALLAIDQEGSTLSPLAKALEVEASTLTRTLDGLEKLGLVERKTSPRDRRSVIVRLTDSGVTKVAAIDRMWNAWFGTALAGLRAEERRAAIRGIAALATAFRDGPCCAGELGEVERA